jgi:hypothetical protein
MIDATVAPKGGFISPFGPTVCNVNHINAGGQRPRGEHRKPLGRCTASSAAVYAIFP